MVCRYGCVHTWTCVDAHVVNIHVHTCGSQMSTSFFEIGSLTGTWGHWFSQAGWPASLWDVSVSTFPLLGLQECITKPVFYMVPGIIIVLMLTKHTLYGRNCLSSPNESHIERETKNSLITGAHFGRPLWMIWGASRSNKWNREWLSLKETCILTRRVAE